MRALQKIDGSLVDGSGPHRRIETWNRFHIVIEDIRSGLKNSSKRLKIPSKVRNQNFHFGLRTLLSDSANGFRENRSAPVRQIIPCHRGHHGIAELHVIDGFRDTARLPWVRRFLGTMRHGAETAVPRAAVAQNEERRRTQGEAFAQVGAAGFLAHGVKLSLLEKPAYFLIGRTARYAPLEPRRFGELLLVFIPLIHMFTGYCILLTSLSH